VSDTSGVMSWFNIIKQTEYWKTEIFEKVKSSNILPEITADSKRSRS